MSEINPLISVIVPVYNVAEFLPRCLASVETQTYKHLEIILINDGATDESGEICDAFAQKEPRATVIHKTNGGPSSARNAGLERASGDYVTFLDSDDAIDANMYEHLLENIIKNHAQISICAFRKTVMFQQPQIKLKVMTQTEAINQLFTIDLNCNISVWNKLYERKLFENIRFPAGQSEDILPNFEVFSRATQVVMSNQALYYYFTHENSISQEGFNMRLLQYPATLDLLLEKVKKSAQKNLKKAEIFVLHGYVWLLWKMIRSGAYKRHPELLKHVQSFIHAHRHAALPWKHASTKRGLQVLFLAYLPPVFYHFLKKR